MSLSRTKTSGLLVVSALLFGSQLRADSNDGAATPKPANDAKPTAPKVRSPQEMQTDAVALHARIDAQVQRALEQQSRARNAKDIIKLDCINNGLVTLKGLALLGDQAYQAFQGAVSSGDTAGQVTQFNALASASQGCDDANGQVERCVGANEAVAVGTSSVVVTHPPIPHDPESDCNNLGLESCPERPIEYVAFASPFTPN